jgi:hypothetical protein
MEIIRVKLIQNQSVNLNKIAMRSLLYVIAVILVIGWVLGAFVYSAGGLIHILLVIAIVVVLLNVIKGGT